MPIITLLTDFGLTDSYVAEMKGAILGICADATLVDISHGIAPQQVGQAAFVLSQAVAAFPKDTVHVAVVDPTVGTARRAVAVATRHARFVAPDNGLLQPALDRLGAYEAVALENRAFWLCDQPSVTFHGRDIFAPVAAHLASGAPFEALGPRIDTLQPLPHAALAGQSSNEFRGQVIHIDRFGNLITNIPAAWLAHETRWTVDAGGAVALVQRTYADAAHGHLVALPGSHGYIELAVNGGHAAHRLGLDVGAPVIIRPQHP